MTTSAHNVLVVDDEEAICWGLGRLLSAEGCRVRLAASAEEALTLAGQQRPDLVVLDVRLPGMDGLAAMQRLEQVAGPVPIVVITAYGNLETAVTAVNRGAVEYLTKPFDLEQVATVVRRALARAIERPLAAPPAGTCPELLVGKCAAMQRVFKQIALVAPTEISVLITGESGTGKELVARAIHRHSARAGQPLLPVNLASLSPTLIESELFGHVRGAFTGAAGERRGLLELADGGTVFFDETGDIPPAVQVKLLRVLEQREFSPVGDGRTKASNFRSIAATNRDVAQCLAEGRLRQDLYFRLAGFEIALPPLRERREDIPLLVEHFLAALAAPPAAPPRISEPAMIELCRRPWPGNVRELKSAIEHGAVLARGGQIGPEHLPPPRPLATASVENASGALRQAVRRWAQARLTDEARGGLHAEFLAIAEPALFDPVLAATQQNRAAAAELLGIHRATLRKKLHEQSGTDD